MPTAREFTVHLEDQPGTIGRFCRQLADRGVNILAFETFETLFRFVVENPSIAKTAMDSEQISYTETEVAQVKLPHRPGELARAASRLGEAKINIDYAYGGLEPGTNAPVVFFGVKEVAQAVKILEQAAAAAGS